MRTVLPLLVAALVCALAPSAEASSKQWTTFEAPTELLDPGARDATLDEIRAFGVDRVRVLVTWRSFAPRPKSKRAPRGFDGADPAAYPAGTWERLDRLFDAAAARGIRVQLTPTGPVPRWATARRSGSTYKPRPSQFRAFVHALGVRYGARVSLWSVWNEPNHPQFLGPQYVKRRPYSPYWYRKLFFAAIAGLRTSGNAGDRVLMGETAPRGTPRVVAPLAFLRGSLCLSRSWRRSPRCGRVPAGGWAHHAYTTAAGPWFVPPDRDDVTIGVLRRLNRAIARAERAGALPRRTGIYLTEFGIQSRPDPYVGVSLAKQAEYIAIAERMAYDNPRVQGFSQYLLHDDKPRPGSRFERFSGFESGLRFSNGRAKPAYDAFRLPLAVRRRGSRAAVWGRVRPAAGATEVVLAGKRGKSWREVRRFTTGAGGVFRGVVGRFDRYRVRWAAPGVRVFAGPPVRAYR